MDRFAGEPVLEAGNILVILQLALQNAPVRFSNLAANTAGASEAASRIQRVLFSAALGQPATISRMLASKDIASASCTSQVQM